MDEILPNTVDNNNSIDAAIGCSTIVVNQPGNVRRKSQYEIQLESFSKPSMYFVILLGNLGTY
jgi:hypothetical protein